MRTVLDVVAREVGLERENARLRELLRRWVDLDRQAAPPADRHRLVEDTKRALLRLGPGWAPDGGERS